MSKTYRHDTRPRWKDPHDQTFRCRRCKLLVGALPSGGRHRNHCPFCLYSRHVDACKPGDRASDCGALMAPVAAYTRRNGEYALVHRCLCCAIERHNRIGADDDFDLVLSLPQIAPPARQGTDSMVAIA
ncbi:MAG TPA: RNHCP domain-containing protein [Chloroflexota bacterium]|nr:RNHCP domain-containing protein [Chloroflexota bacterium]